MIESLSIRNFKVLRAVDLDLKPLTVVVGPNSSGKSSVLHALNHLTRLGDMTRPPEEVSAGWLMVPGLDVDKGWFRSRPLDSLRSKQSKGPTYLHAAGTFGGQTLVLKVEILEGGRFRFTGKLNDETLDGSRNLNSPLKSTLLKLDVNKLGTPSYPKNASLILPDDGEGLASILSGIYLEDIMRYKSIVEQTKRVIPGLRDIHIKQVPMGSIRETKVGYQAFFDMKGAEGIPADRTSDGTLLTLALVTALSTPTPPSLVMIDDIERGFHPKALKDLVQQLREVQKEIPDLQIVATSHSPYLLDFLDASEIILTSLDEEGYSSVQPLVQHPEYEKWKGFMAPGEFWSSVGEDWITKNKKATA
jgi:hypothetical protein